MIEKILDACESLGWEVIETFFPGKFVLSKYSPAGTCYSFDIEANDPKGFINAVTEECEDFDAEYFADEMRKNIEAGLDCDMTDDELYADAENIAEMLEELSFALSQVDVEVECQ